jgi:hypothetical protein
MLLHVIALALSLWIASDTHHRLELRVTVPAEAIEIDVIAACPHGEQRSGRHLAPSSPPQTFLFSRLHPDLYTVQVSVLLENGRIQQRQRDVVVTN